MDQAVPETRSRSRSKTPFTLRSSCDGENCNEATHNHEKPKTKKQPTVQTIVEEKEEPKNDTQRKSARQKIATSDYSSDDTSHSEASKNNKEVGVVKTTTTTTTSKITVKASGAEKSRVSRNVTVSKESSQNSINAAVEKNNKSRSVPQRSTNSSLNSSSSSVEGKDALGYQEYVAAGEYWNKFPKTDYTYSILSPHRRELAPGQIAMPNMSRSGLHKHFERVSNLIRRNPEQEAYIRQRYLSKMQSSQYDSYQRKETQYDSGDEIDNQYRNYSYSIKKESVIRRIFTSIFTFFYTCVYRVTHIFSPATQNYQQYSRFAHEEKGFFGKIGSFISKSFLAIFQKIYLFISTVLYLDSWSLQSKNPDNGNKKRLLLGALVLLPLLLLAAWCLMDEAERNKNLVLLTSQLQIPFSMVAVKSYFQNLGNKFSFDLPELKWRSDWFSFPSSSHYEYNHIVNNNIKGSLSVDEYNRIINHINSYVDKMIIDKVKDEPKRDTDISKEMTLLISSIIKEQIIEYKYELTEKDCERIAALVRRKINLEEDLKKPMEQQFTLSQDNLELISAAIKSNLKSELKGTELPVQLDVDEILYKVLSSNKLEAIVLEKLKIQTEPQSKKLDDHQKVIVNLANDIKNIKIRLESKANVDIVNDLNKLQGNHDNLIDSLGEIRSENKIQLEQLKVDFDMKLAQIKNDLKGTLDQRIKLILLEIMGYKEGSAGQIQDADIRKWIDNVFVAKELLENRLNQLSVQFDGKLKDAIAGSSDIIMKLVAEQIKNEILLRVEKKNDEIIRQIEINSRIAAGSGMSEIDVEKIVQKALAIYDADKTGLADFALESAGGQVLSTRCTESYQPKTAQLSIFGIPLWYRSNTPRTAITPAVQPGDCWSFQGFPGYLVLKLNRRVHVSGFTVEHIPKNLAVDGRIDSAPKLFTVWGLEDVNDQDSVMFGKYEYIENGTSLQYFQVQNVEITKPYDIIEMRIESNHGNMNYTCLYRFRVHGNSV